MKLNEKQIKQLIAGLTDDRSEAKLWAKSDKVRIYINKKTGSRKSYGYIDCNEFNNSKLQYCMRKEAEEILGIE